MKDLRRSGSVGALRVTAILLALLALSSPADARARWPISLRIEGFFEAAPEGVRPLRTVEVRLGRETTRRLAVARIVNLGSGVLGPRILDDAARYRPSFRMLGDQILLARLEAAPRGRRVTITGNLTSGRNVMLSLVEVETEPGASSTPTPSPAAR